MTTYSKYNVVYRLQRWIDSVPGQTFLNYAYSWGAAIVIFGTLCKLTHIPGANFWLFLGMGTEVVVFFLSAFDRPFDKTAEGRDIPMHLPGKAPESVTVQVEQPSGSVPTAPVSVVPAAHPEMEEAQKNYVEELRRLTDLLQKVGEQSRRLSRDSEEMENLNRTLTGISKVYEMQLKSASRQIGTIDQINEQSRQMAHHIEQLNAIYARMIEAMTVNMRAAAPVAGGASASGSL